MTNKYLTVSITVIYDRWFSILSYQLMKRLTNPTCFDKCANSSHWQKTARRDKITRQNSLISLNHHRKLTSNLHWLYSSLKSPLCWFCASTHPVYCRDMCVMSSLTKPARPRPKCRSTLFVCVEAAAILEDHHTHTYAQPGLLRGWLTEQRLYLHFTDWQIRIMYPLRSTAEPTQSQRHAGFHQADSFF